MLREDYPNPKFIRPRMKCLNGSWDFSDAINGPLGEENITFKSSRNIPDEQANLLNSQRMAYRRLFQLSEADIAGSVILKVQEIYGDSLIYVNNILAFQNTGFSQAITLDISSHVISGENSITIYLTEPTKNFKKIDLGVRGNIWVEFAAKSYFSQVVLRTSLADSAIYMTGKLLNVHAPLALSCELKLGENVIANYSYDAGAELNIRIPIPEPVVFWKELEGNLYDVKITLSNAKGGICDLFYSYVGFRNITIIDNSFHINEKPTFLKFVKDSKMIARHLHSPMKIRQFLSSILLLGFNGIDCSEFEPSSQFIYIADKLGFFIFYSLLPHDCIIEKSDYSTLLSLASSSLLRNTGSPSITLCTLSSHFELESIAAQNLIKAVITIRNDILVSTYSQTHIMGHFLCYPLYYSTDEQCLSDVHTITLTASVLFRFGQTPFVGAYSQKNSEFNEEDVFLDNFRYMTRAMLASKALGYSYEALHDSVDNLNGLYLYNEENKLSRNGILSIKKYNEQRSLAELNHILKNQP